MPSRPILRNSEQKTRLTTKITLMKLLQVAKMKKTNRMQMRELRPTPRRQPDTIIKFWN